MLSNLRPLHKKNKQQKTSSPPIKENPSQSVNYKKSKEGILNILRHVIYMLMVIVAPIAYMAHRIILFERGRMLIAAGVLVFGLLAWYVADQGIKRLIGDQVSGKRVMQTEEIFSVSRHPFYVAQTIIIFAVAILFPSWIIGIILAGYLLVTYMTIRTEEENMLREFGSKYRDYKETTPIMPWNPIKLLFP